MKHLFIINPIAGKGHCLKLIPEIEKIFLYLKEEYKIEITQGPGHATELVKTYVSEEDYRIYAVGGDGTLNEVLNGMVDSNSSLGVIPAGSGNDYIKSISKNPKENILYRTITGKESYVDLGKLNDRYFLNIASSGIDAKIVYNARKLKKLPLIPGSFAYVLAIIYTIFQYEMDYLKIQIDDLELQEYTTLVAFGKGCTYGGGMKVMPNASITDGNLHLCLVKKLSKFKMLVLFHKLIEGNHGEISEYVSFHKCKTAKLTCTNEMIVNIDGELIRSREVNISVLPMKIKFIVP